VAKQQLDLLKFTTARAAQLRARTAEIVRGDAGNTGSRRIGFDKLPDDLLAQRFACDAASAVYRTEDVSFRRPGWRCPRIDGHLHPGRHWRGADPSVFADQINDAPAAIALLQVRESERGHLGAP
jgi:hypothetical protein